jgi:ketosteroid isomerase-like protein
MRHHRYIRVWKKGKPSLDTPLINVQNNLQGINYMNKKIFLKFVNAINEHNVENLCSLMTDNHKFIDSQGNEIVGKEKIKEGWIMYFHIFPDYNIEITDIFFDGDTVAAFGFADAAFLGQSDIKGNNWHLPASWKAIIKTDKVELWQVYADSKIPFDIINKNKTK